MSGVLFLPEKYHLSCHLLGVLWEINVKITPSPPPQSPIGFWPKRKSPGEGGDEVGAAAWHHYGRMGWIQTP